MRIIEWNLETGMVGGARRGEFDVEDDATEDEIDEMVRDEISNYVSWGWTERAKDEAAS